MTLLQLKPISHLALQTQPGLGANNIDNQWTFISSAAEILEAQCLTQIRVFNH